MPASSSDYRLHIAIYAGDEEMQETEFRVFTQYDLKLFPPLKLTCDLAWIILRGMIWFASVGILPRFNGPRTNVTCCVTRMQQTSATQGMEPTTPRSGEQVLHLPLP